MRVTLAQLNTTVGDLAGNAEMIVTAARTAHRDGAQLLVTPECALTGYPVEDLACRAGFVQAAEQALADLAGRLHTVAPGLTCVVGTVTAATGPSADTAVRIAANTAAVIANGAVQARIGKHRLPTYSVFDEARVFVPSCADPAAAVVDVAGVAVGVTVCEDLWPDGDRAAQLAAAGAQLVVSLNASPFHVASGGMQAKTTQRRRLLTAAARAGGVPVVYVNQVGGQDEVVFDGDSQVTDAAGATIARLAQFTHQVVTLDVPGPPRPPGLLDLADPPLTPEHDRDTQVWAALVCAVADYVAKTGFDRVVIGLSGGIDSAVTAAVAVDALGPDRVTGVGMPGPHSSPGSLTDAAALAANLGIAFTRAPITDLVPPVHATLLAGPLPDGVVGVTAENIQARLRGMLLMAVSNATGALVLTTGNKSEYAVGYATLYGDMSGGFAPLRDVPKTWVFDLARWCNARAGTDRIPQATIDKPPSAELAPDQRDDDTLPPYPVLDAILDAYIDAQVDPAQLPAHIAAPDVTARVCALVDRAEHKRRQAAPGPKVTARAFGRDRRLPLASRWRPARGS